MRSDNYAGSNTLEYTDNNILEEIEDYAILLLDMEGNIKNGNKGSEIIKGYSPCEIAGCNFRVFYTREDREKKLPEKLLEEAKRNGKAHHEGWRVRKDGSKFWGDVVITALHDDQNNVVGYSKITRDLTEQHRQHEFDRNSMQALINNTKDIIWSVDKDYRLIASNQLFDEVYARVNGKSIAKGDCALAEVHDHKLFTKWSGYYQRALNGAAFTEIEYTDLPVEKWSEVSFYPIREGDTIAGVACYSHDITRLKKAEHELTDVHNQLLFHLNNSPMAFIEWDNELHVKTWSKEAVKIFGWSEQEFISLQKNGYSQVYEEDLPWVSKKAQQLLTGDLERNSVQHRNITKDGRVIWCEWFNSILKDKDGKVVTIMSLVHDITKQKEAEEKINYANRLYSFTSQINQAIVRVTDKQALFKETCRIAVECGKFKVAWISLINTETKKIDLAEECGMPPEDIARFTNTQIISNGPQDQVLKTDSHYICNNVEKDFQLPGWKQWGALRGIRSFMILPIKISGSIIGTFNLYAEENNFFNAEEIKLLEGATEDISFAIGIYEKEKLRKETETKLKHSELRLTQAQEVAHFGNWEMEFSTGIGTWSEEACRIYGLDINDNRHTFEKWLSFIHPDDLDHVMRMVKEGQANLSNAAFFHRIIWRDGTVRHIHSISQLEFKDGIPIGLHGVAHDVTEMTEVQEALRQSKTNLRLIVDLLPQAVFAKDYNGKFVFVNKTFAALYGLTPKQLVYKTIEETIPDDNEPDYFLNQDRKVIDTGITKIIPELKFTDNTGTERLFYTTKVPYVTAGKNQKAVLGIALDVTEQKQAEAEKSKIVADIVQRNKDLEQFSYIVSHNLRAPVANIIGLSDLLRIAEYDREDELAMLKGLSDSVKKLDMVIKDLNYILQIKNQLSEKRTPVIFSDLLGDIAFSIENMLRKENVKIISDFSASDELLTVKSYLYSIFINLITNSVKYRQPGVQPVIEITSRRNNNKTELIFKDNGLGIDLERRGEYVFGLYKRFHDHVEGKGMGLYMVKAQVEKLGGKISIQSEVNKGTTFKIEFEIG